MRPCPLWAQKVFPDQDMNRQSDNGHFTPTVVCKAHCCLETISPDLEVSSETTDSSLSGGRMQKQYQKCCFGEGKVRPMNNRWLAMFVPPVLSSLMAIDVSSFHQIASHESSFQTQGKKGARERAANRRRGGEWDHLWMLRRMLGQPILCPDNYQVPAELVGCWNLEKKEKKKKARNKKKNYALLSMALRPSRVSALVREKTNVQYDWSAARNEQMCSLKSWETSDLGCVTDTHSHTHTHTYIHSYMAAYSPSPI